jgi:hypothetical protein
MAERMRHTCAFYPRGFAGSYSLAMSIAFQRGINDFRLLPPIYGVAQGISVPISWGSLLYLR